MKPRDLRDHKKVSKQLTAIPVFKPLKRNSLPKPFKKFGGPRFWSSGMIDVSAEHVVMMLWRDGDILTDRSFYAYLLCTRSDGKLSPLCEFHWHPSHKGFHCKTPCQSNVDYTNRLLVQAQELRLTTDDRLDPREEPDRNKLVIRFCEITGIALPTSDSRSEQ